MIFAKKSLGQNYLIDKNIINKIINRVDIKNKNVIEIGPGKGALTKEIIKKKPRSLLLIEKDDKLSKILKQEYSDKDKIEVLNQDVLKFNFNNIKKKNSIIFGNLPYNISSQILVKIIKSKVWPPNYKDVIFMFQKELGEKIIAKYPSSNYGRLSILTNYRFNILGKFLVSPNCFFPKPKVLSMIVHLKPKKKINIHIKNMEKLEKITNIFFSNKRKMINKNLKKVLSGKKLKFISNLDVKIRPENVSPEMYYKITNLSEN